MKKVLIYSILVISVLILLLSQFGVQIGNVRIGKQIDLKISQKNDFQNSNFYTKYFESNKLICLNTWATWCVPCIDEIPNLNKLKNDYANKDIAFLSLSIDDDSLKLRKFLDKKTFNFEDITLNNLSYRDAILNTIEEKKIDA